MYRGWQNHPAFKKEPFTEREAWEWIISAAAFEPHTINLNGTPVNLERGQLSHSIRFMADIWGWNSSRVERFLKKLKKWDMIVAESGTGQNVITVCKYRAYQDKKRQSGTAAGQQSGQQRDSSGTNNKESKESKEIDDVVRGGKKEFVVVGKQIAKLTGWDKDPNWFGNYSRIEMWLKSGWSPELDIYPTVKKILATRHGSPPNSINYFEKAIATAYEQRNKPIAQGDQNGTNRAAYQKPTKSDQINAAARESLEELGFGES